MTIAAVHAHGTAREMGRAQGGAFAGGIHEALRFYSEIKPHPTDLRPYIEAARRVAPSSADEVEGIAEGAGISIEEAWWLNCIEEVADFDACTTMVHGRWLMHAEQWYAGHSAVGVVIAHPDSGPDFISPTCVGFLPAVGLNSSGFAQGIDSLWARDDRVGVPRIVVSRQSLGAPTFTEAIAAACMPGRAGGYAHTLVSATERVVVETSATIEQVLRNTDVHTNHYLPPAPGIAPRPSKGSAARLTRGAELLRDSPPQTIDECAALLGDHTGTPQSICLHETGPAAEATVFAMVCDVATGEVVVSDGPPCVGRWERFRLPLSEAIVVD